MRPDTAPRNSRLYQIVFGAFCRCREAAEEVHLNVPCCEVVVTTKRAHFLKMFGEDTQAAQAGGFFEPARTGDVPDHIVIDGSQFFTRRTRSAALKRQRKLSPPRRRQADQAEARLKAMERPSADKIRSLRRQYALDTWPAFKVVVHEAIHAALAHQGFRYAHGVEFRSAATALGSLFGLRGPTDERAARSWPMREDIEGDASGIDLPALWQS